MVYILLLFASNITGLLSIALRKNVADINLANQMQYSDFISSVFMFYGMMLFSLVAHGVFIKNKILDFIKIILLLLCSHYLLRCILEVETHRRYFAIFYAILWTIVLFISVFKDRLLFSNKFEKHIFFMTSSGIFLMLILFAGASRRHFPEPFATFLYSDTGLNVVFATTHASVAAVYIALKRKLIKYDGL